MVYEFVIKKTSIKRKGIYSHDRKVGKYMSKKKKIRSTLNL